MSARKVPKLSKYRTNAAGHDETPGLAEAREALAKRKGPPSEGDAPRLSTFPKREATKAKQIPGQTSLPL